jgi:hypothetical protein
MPFKHHSTDAETGLRDAACLLYDLAVGREAPRALEVVSLADGTIGEPFVLVEDPALGARVGAALQAAAEPLGRAYRVSDSVYAIVTPRDGARRCVTTSVRTQLEPVAPRLAARAVAARVTVPEEATPGRAALRLALDRLRQRSGWQGRVKSTAIAGRDVLLQLMEERRVAGEALRRHEIVAHALVVGRRMSLTVEELEELVRAAELQDVGLLTLPEALLCKTAALTDEEWEVVRRHPLAGARILSASPELAPVARIVRSAYERFDGTGYPHGLRGEAIPLESRIIAVCVAFVAMTSKRPYRTPLSAQAALDELEERAGHQFDPRVVGVFREAAQPSLARLDIAA